MPTQKKDSQKGSPAKSPSGASHSGRDSDQKMTDRDQHGDSSMRGSSTGSERNAGKTDERSKSGGGASRDRQDDTHSRSHR
jgi:hypothetical protein